MPSSSVDSYDLIEQSLQSSLNGPSTSCNDGSAVNSFEENLLASSKKVLLSKIEFEPAGKNYSFSLKNLKNKYIHLNPERKSCKNNDSTEMNGNGYNHSPPPEDDGIPTPKVMIHPPDRVTLGWQRVYRIGAGLLNMGNTCFLNAILQCLTYTPPLVNHLIEFDEHSTNCKMVGFCMMCELFRHIRRALEKNGETIKPQCILQKLKAIAKNMAWGHQEDAHEFLRYIMESMIKSSLKGYSSSSLDRISLETTVVNHIFGGYHRSQVICLKCKSKSDTYEHFMDLILDIKTVPSLEKAMEKFVQAELLDNDNAYMCPRCLKKCPAQKRFSIHRAPNIATFQLKRFDYNRMMGGKISKNISFPEKLDMRSYMSQTQGPPVKYQLYAVLVHQGASCSSGHYFCFVRNSNNLWYCMDDCRIRQVSLNIVLSQQAYLLFYTRVANNPTYFTKTTTVQPASNVQTTHNSIVLNGNGTANGTSNTPNTANHDPHNKIINNTQKQNATCTTVNGNGNIRNRNPRIIAATGPLTPLAVPADPEQQTQQPRIVMHIKNGKVTSCEQQWNEKNKEKDENCHVNLVPYGADSSSESELDEAKPGLPSDELDDGKIKATSSWVVTSTGSPSPAASECSSVKSTIVGWTVTRVDVKEEEKGNGRTYAGWTVTEKDVVPHRLLGGKEVSDRRFYEDDSQLLRHRRKSLARGEEDRRHSDTEAVGVGVGVGRSVGCLEEKREVCRVNGAAEEEEEEEKKGRKRRRHEEERERKRRRRSKNSKNSRRRHEESEHSSDDSDKSYELEWVERTKETMEQERQQSSVTAKHRDENPHNNTSTQNGKDRYDERRHSTNNGIVDYFKNIQQNAYGSKVNSWNGGQSSLDRESCSAAARWQENDDYDDEYDKGRVKKTKMYKPNRNEFGRFNPFQRCQNDRNYYTNNSNNKQDRPPFNSFSRKPSHFHHNHNHRSYSNCNFKYQNNKFRGKKQNGGL